MLVESRDSVRASRLVTEALTSTLSTHYPHTHQIGGIHTPPDRLVLFGREGMLFSPPPNNTPSTNQSLANTFINLQNQLLEKEGVPNNLHYSAMTTMKVGRELQTILLSNEPLKITVGSSTFIAGTFEGNCSLIDRIGRMCVEQASGIITCASMNSAPNTYFRCVELQAIRENAQISGVRVIHSSRGMSPEEQPVLSSKVYSVQNWIYAQKEQWWASSLDQLSSHYISQPALPNSLTDTTVEMSKARFLGELYHAAREIEYLSASSTSSSQLKELQRERTRLTEGIKFLNEYPDTLSFTLSPRVSLALAKMFVYDLPEDAKERRYVLGQDSVDICKEFVIDSIASLIKKIERMHHTYK